MRLYFHPITWRLAQFGLTHPNEAPTRLQHTALPSDLALFIPVDAIANVREVRDWLHDSAHVNARYSLFGCYGIEQLKYRSRSLFRGIIILFQQALDVVLFRFAWDSRLLSEIRMEPRKRAA